MGTSTPSVPASDQSASDGSAPVAFSRFNPESARESSGNPDADSGDEVTRVAAAVPRSQIPTVRIDSDIRAAVSQIGRTIEGKYRLDAVIGTGGMGSVYRATRLLIGDLVAIKLLHREQVSELQSSERFQREAQAAARLNHTNAVRMFDFGVTNDGLAYLVMELVEGQSLRRVIKEQGPLKPSLAADIINQVCAALDEAHRHQIVHRDLKPDNILVNVKITGLQVKVLDFGIAKMRDVTASNLTQTGSVMGTPHYMSPEQCLGEELDGRSDIYSLGIILYEMLVGVVPFNSPSSTRVVVQHVNQAPPSLRGINFSISQAAEDAVLHALAKKPEDRPQTARALAAEFSAAVDAGLPLDGGGQTPRTDAPDVAPLNTTVVMTRTPTGSGLGQPYAGAVPSPQPRKSGYWVPFILFGALLLAVGVIVGLLIDANNRKRASDIPAPVSTPSPRNDNTADNQTGGQSSSTPEPDRRPSPTPPNIPAPTVAQTPPPPPSYLPNSFQRSYHGTIGKGVGLRVALSRSGSSLTGRASTSGSTDTLQGEIDTDGSFTLYGYENGGPLTGIYTGKMRTDGTISGLWTSTANGKKTTFFLRQE